MLNTKEKPKQSDPSATLNLTECKRKKIYIHAKHA